MRHIHTKCRVVHELTDRAQDNIGYYLGKLEQENDSGWSPETLEMIRLDNDARELRALADRMDALRANMTKQEQEAA